MIIFFNISVTYLFISNAQEKFKTPKNFWRFHGQFSRIGLGGKLGLSGRKRRRTVVLSNMAGDLHLRNKSLLSRHCFSTMSCKSFKYIK